MTGVGCDRGARVNTVQDPILDRAIALLRSRPDRGICIHCLAECLAESRATLARLAIHGDVSHTFATCAICEKPRLVLRAEVGRR